MFPLDFRKTGWRILGANASNPPYAKTEKPGFSPKATTDPNLDSEDQAPSSSRQAPAARRPDVTPGHTWTRSPSFRLKMYVKLPHAYFLPVVGLKSTQITRDIKRVASPFQAPTHIQLLRLSLRGKEGYYTHSKDEDTEAHGPQLERSARHGLAPLAGCTVLEMGHDAQSYRSR